VDLDTLLSTDWFYVTNVTETTLNGIEPISGGVAPAFNWPLSGAVINIDGTVTPPPSTSIAGTLAPNNVSRPPLENRERARPNSVETHVIQLPPLHIRTFAVDLLARPTEKQSNSDQLQ